MRTVPRRTVAEWHLKASSPFGNPFTDTVLTATFTAPSGVQFSIRGFYDGDNSWVVRFNPGESGAWTYAFSALPEDPGLRQTGCFEVTGRSTGGMVRATPDTAWGFSCESGDPVLFFGDTCYNLFGVAHCGGEFEQFIRRRKSQGFNVLRIRVQVSPFHGPDAYSNWQERSTWSWGGSPQMPQFDKFNLEWFRTVDAVMRRLEELEMGVEFILEAWASEFPFNARDRFLPEWEELWVRYVVSRYDAFNCLWVWTGMNEHEHYPDGNCRHKRLTDLFAMRICRMIKSAACHGHVVAIHNGPQMPPFARRFAIDPDAIDAIMFQTWGTFGESDAWLASGIEDDWRGAFEGWRGSMVLSEYGYEAVPTDVLFPLHGHCDTHHCRRAMWRGVMCGMGVIHGYENTWGPRWIPDRDQASVAEVLVLKRFLDDVVPFHSVKPAHELVEAASGAAWGHKPLALASADRARMVVYLPAGGPVTIQGVGDTVSARWFDPRNGALTPAAPERRGGNLYATAPVANDERGRPLDWVLVVQTE